MISDYNKGFLTYEHIENIINSFDGPIFIDTKKQNLSRFNAKNVFIKINEVEFEKLSSKPENLIVTLGDRGAQIDNKIFPTTKVDIVDVCGCGDTFLSALTYQYLETESIEQAIIFANKAATITVQHTGNYSPSRKEIENGY
jgi:sugar/nucleoside kinase (ribokinase family)